MIYRFKQTDCNTAERSERRQTFEDIREFAFCIFVRHNIQYA